MPDTTKTNEQERPPIPQRSALRSVCIALVCTAAMITNNANLTATSIALPTIGKDLNMPETELQWLVSGFSLSSGCLFLFFGRIADLYGRKKTFVLGCLWLALFALGSAFAKDGIALAILRGLAGVGVAAMIPASIGILAHSFPPGVARSRAFATFAAGAPLGAVVGMVIGGVLTEYASDSWRAPFFLLFAPGILCALGGFFSFDADHPSEESDRRVDWLGTALSTIGLVFIIFVLGQGEAAPKKWATPYIIALLILGVFFLALFLLWEHHLEQHPSPRKPPPLMKLSLWTRSHGQLAVIMGIAFIEWASFMGYLFWVQLYYQDYLSLRPILTVLRFIPMFVTGVIINIIVALVVGRIPLVYLVLLGTVATGLAAVLFAIINPTSVYWHYSFPSAIIVVFGADFVFATGTLFIAKVAEGREQSLAGGLFQTMTQLGTALGLTVSTIVFNRVVASNSNSTTSTALNSPAQLKGYRAAQWTLSAFAFLAALLTIVFLRGVGIVGHRGGPGEAGEANVAGDEEVEVRGVEESLDEDRESTGEKQKEKDKKGDGVV